MLLALHACTHVHLENLSDHDLDHYPTACLCVWLCRRCCRWCVSVVLLCLRCRGLLLVKLLAWQHSRASLTASSVMRASSCMEQSATTQPYHRWGGACLRVEGLVEGRSWGGGGGSCNLQDVVQCVVRVGDSFLSDRQLKLFRIKGNDPTIPQVGRPVGCCI